MRPHALRFALSTVAAGTRPQPSLLQRTPHPTSLGPLLHTCRFHSSPSHTTAAGTGCAVNCGPRSMGATSQFPQPTLSQRRATPCLWGAAVLGRELCEPQSHDSGIFMVKVPRQHSQTWEPLPGQSFSLRL